MNRSKNCRLLTVALSSLIAGTGYTGVTAGAEYAGMSRVIYPALEIKDVLVSNMIVMLLGLVVSAYPATKAARFTPVEALAHT